MFKLALLFVITLGMKSIAISVFMCYCCCLRDCDDKTVLKEGDNKVTKIKGISGMGRYSGNIQRKIKK